MTKITKCSECQAESYNDGSPNHMSWCSEKDVCGKLLGHQDTVGTYGTVLHGAGPEIWCNEKNPCPIHTNPQEQVKPEWEKEYHRLFDAGGAPDITPGIIDFIRQTLSAQAAEIVKMAEEASEQITGGGNGRRILIQLIGNIKEKYINPLD